MISELAVRQPPPGPLYKAMNAIAQSRLRSPELIVGRIARLELLPVFHNPVNDGIRRASKLFRSISLSEHLTSNV